MAGHNKWSKVKHKKAAADQKKSKTFSLLARYITVEAKKCGGDREAPGLRAMIAKARAANMPNENIERAIARATDKTASSYETVLYEAYGPKGCALIITGITDNKNRTAQEIKHILSKHGVALATPGAAQWAFEKKGDTWTPHTYIDLNEEEKQQMKTLIAALEECEDIQNVLHNASL